MDRNSSDGEEDHRSLIPVTRENGGGGGLRSPRSTLQIEEISRSHNRHKILLDKRYIVGAVSLALLVAFIYFTVNLSSIKLDPSSSSRVKESELRALYLLKQQQLALVSLLVNQTQNLNSSDSSVVVVDNVKAALEKQILINKEIEDVLLSPHRTGNYSGTGTDLDSISVYERCRKVDQKLSDRKTIEWKPRSDKYLFAICLSGQMSNHLICLEKHMFFELGHLVCNEANSSFQLGHESIA